MKGTRGPLQRWLAFSSVGTMGFGVQFVALLVLAGWFEINYLLATALAVEIAIVHNFFWHQRWTWADRGSLSPRQMAERLLRFNAGTSVTSIGGNLTLMWVFVSMFDIHYAVANVMAVLSLSIVNYLFCDRLVFRMVQLPMTAAPLAADGSEG